jgi:hypothetical protein
LRKNRQQVVKKPVLVEIEQGRGIRLQKAKRSKEIADAFF